MENNIFQTHKSIEYIKSKPKILNAVKSWTKHSNNFKYFFYSDELCDKFMREKFSGNVYNAYLKLPMAVMKADLFRYCVIYFYGGIYADTDTICMVNPYIFIKNNSLLTIVPESDSIHLCQWVFSAPKNSPILKSIIDLSVEKILLAKEIKGEHVIHELTGPLVFTEGIEKYLKQHNKPTFSNKINYYKYPDNKTLCVFNCDIFHSKIVKHLFAGDDDDGWKKERDIKLKT
jgi:mannosyltransferase OCH1-like enzyme